MAKKVDASEMPVEQKLKNLFQLQTTLSKIDEIKTLRGELPLEVQDLEDEIEGLNTRLSKLNSEIEGLREDIQDKLGKIKEAEASVERYTEQQNNIKNNREYDILGKEIEYQTLEVQLQNKRINEANKEIERKEKGVEDITHLISERTKDLDVKKGELEEIVTETKAEEKKLMEKSKTLETQIDPRLLNAFKRIRKNSNNGLGIVYVERDSCGGCFNKIPPQRQLDIRMHKKIIVCEYCGRVMIDPELAGIKVEAPKEAKTKRRRAAAKK